VVATNVGDISAMLPAANQPFIAPPKAEALLGAQLQRLVERPDLRGTIGDLNRRHAQESFDRRTMLERYQDLFSSLIPG
jgi:glycosyltransferase involved in cell wall biosynthesis